MTEGLKGLTRKDILYGAIVPVIVALVIIAFPLSEKALTSIYPPFVGILVFGTQEAIMVVIVPMLIGLLWNKWAGGSVGFLMGSIYALWYAIYGVKTAGWTHDIGLLGYLLSGALIGYISGALNKKSKSLRRMVFAGVTAGVLGGLFLFFTEQFSVFQMMSNAFGFFVIMVPRIIFGFVVPLFAKLFHRYSATPQFHFSGSNEPPTNSAE
jgi:hypothetical protein